MRHSVPPLPDMAGAGRYPGRSLLFALCIKLKYAYNIDCIIFTIKMQDFAIKQRISKIQTNKLLVLHDNTQHIRAADCCVSERKQSGFI